MNRKGDRREAASERSEERIRGPTNRNRKEAGMVRTNAHAFVRYADDCNIYLHSERAGQL